MYCGSNLQRLMMTETVHRFCFLLFLLTIVQFSLSHNGDWLDSEEATLSPTPTTQTPTGLPRISSDGRTNRVGRLCWTTWERNAAHYACTAIVVAPLVATFFLAVSILISCIIFSYLRFRYSLRLCCGRLDMDRF